MPSLFDMSLDPTVVVAVVSALAAVASAFVSWSGLRRQSLPDVIAYVGPSPEFPDFAALYIRNVGNAPAFDVRAEIDGEMPDAFEKWGGGASKSFIETGVPMLAPDAVRGVMVAPFDVLMEWDAPASLGVSWARRQGSRLRMSGKYPVEFRSFGGVLTGGADAKEYAEAGIDGTRNPPDSNIHRLLRSVGKRVEALAHPGNHLMGDKDGFRHGGDDVFTAKRDATERPRLFLRHEFSSIMSAFGIARITPLIPASNVPDTPPMPLKSTESMMSFELIFRSA